MKPSATASPRQSSDRLRVVPEHERVEPHAVTHAASEELPDGDVERAALDVPERDVDGADGAGEDAAAERAHPVEDLADVLDPERVLAQEILTELGDDGDRRVGEPPRPRLTEADDAGIGRDADDQIGADLPAADQQRLDLSDAHGSLPPVRSILGRPVRGERASGAGGSALQVGVDAPAHESLARGLGGRGRAVSPARCHLARSRRSKHAGGLMVRAW